MTPVDDLGTRTLLLDTYLALKKLSVLQFGASIGLPHPTNARRYLQTNHKGGPNSYYRPPSRKIQFKIRKWSDGNVTLNDWPDKSPEIEAEQRRKEEAWRTKRAIREASQSAKPAALSSRQTSPRKAVATASSKGSTRNSGRSSSASVSRRRSTS